MGTPPSVAPDARLLDGDREEALVDRSLVCVAPCHAPPVWLEIGARIGARSRPEMASASDDREIGQREQQLPAAPRHQPGMSRSRKPRANTAAKMSAPPTPRQTRQRPKMTSAMQTQPRPAMMSSVKLPSTASVMKAPPDGHERATDHEREVADPGPR